MGRLMLDKGSNVSVGAFCLTCESNIKASLCLSYLFFPLSIVGFTDEEFGGISFYNIV